MRRKRKLTRGEVKKRNRKIVILSLSLLFILSVGYGAFQTTLNVNVTGKIKIDSECVEGKVWEFTQKDEGQEFRVPCSGQYKVELWGAQGGGGNEKFIGGLGGYTSGRASLKMNRKYYVYVGSHPTYISISCLGDNPNRTFNCNYDAGSCSGGGGATDLRILKTNNWYDFISLKTRIIVAAGGGGAIYDGYGGAAGGICGYNGEGMSDINSPAFYIGIGGTQLSYYFGVGNRLTTIGGGGYYGGNGGRGGNAGGGSSFISGHDGCDAISEQSTQDNIIHTGQSIHYSGLYFTDTVMIDGAGYKWTDHKLEDLGVVGMPTHDGTGTMVGNEGDGFAKITLLTRKPN